MTNSMFNKKILEKARIMVVGCGALGNEVLKNLALIGVNNIVIVDFDDIESHNLSRSVLFSAMNDSLGKLKVDVAAEAIRKINPETNILAINGDISADVGLGLIKEMDVVLGCVDNRWARYCINRFCMRAGIPWIDGGISGLEGTVRIFEPGKRCYACMLSNEDLSEMKKRFSCAGNIHRAFLTHSAPATPLIASIIGAAEVQEALKIIHNKCSETYHFETLSDKILVYDGKYNKFAKVILEAYDDDCSVHEEWKPVIKSNITGLSSIKEALSIIRLQLTAQSATILLTNDCFVDYIYDKDTNEQFSVMLPGRKVEEFIIKSPVLNKKPVGNYYQNEIWNFHKDSPYLDLTLTDIGIPNRDILKVRCGIKGLYRERDFFIEMK